MIGRESAWKAVFSFCKTVSRGKRRLKDNGRKPEAPVLHYRRKGSGLGDGDGGGGEAGWNSRGNPPCPPRRPPRRRRDNVALREEHKVLPACVGGGRRGDGRRDWLVGNKLRLQRSG